MSAALPFGAPASTHFTMVAISSSDNDTSFLKWRDADVLVDVPWRHFAREDLLLDRFGPRPHVLIGQQRHGREGIRPMTHLAAVLQDGRHILRKRDRCLARTGDFGGRGYRRHRRTQENRNRKSGSHRAASSDQLLYCIPRFPVSSQGASGNRSFAVVIYTESPIVFD